MKKFFLKALAVFLVCVSALCFSSCGGQGRKNGLSLESAKTLMQEYLERKGFDENDILAEGEEMYIDGRDVYVFSWRVKDGAADRLFGMYAISSDGKTFYEYHSARGEWIKDMGTDN